jgi:hypothetical protein
VGTAGGGGCRITAALMVASCVIGGSCVYMCIRVRQRGHVAHAPQPDPPQATACDSCALLHGIRLAPNCDYTCRCATEVAYMAAIYTAESDRLPWYGCTALYTRAANNPGAVPYRIWWRFGLAPGSRPSPLPTSEPHCTGIIYCCRLRAD